MNIRTEFLIYMSTLAFALSSGAVRYKLLDAAARIFLWLIIVIAFSELLSYGFALKFKNNYPVYHIFSMVHLIFISAYFYRLFHYKRPLLLYSFWLVAIILGIANMYFFQPLTSLNSNYLLLEGFCIMCLGTYSLYKIFINNAIINIFGYIHFWLWVCILVLWALSYYYWGFYVTLYKEWPYWKFVSNTYWLINVFIYLGVGCTFLLFKKPYHE